jgi:E3 ubiquitin-protein ligase DOA10
MKVYELNERLEGQCKICLAEEEQEDNFFVSPCSCKGSCSIVHINCLKRWIESKMVVKQHDLAISYNFTKFECEICKDPYPKIIKRNDVGHELFVLKRPNNPYIMLEGLQQ